MIHNTTGEEGILSRDKSCRAVTVLENIVENFSDIHHPLTYVIFEFDILFFSLPCSLVVHLIGANKSYDDDDHDDDDDDNVNVELR